MKQPESVRKDMNEVLANLSSHLDAIAGQIFEIEEAVGLLLVQRVNMESSTIARLQKLDFVRQSLQDIAILSHLLKREDCSIHIEIETIVPKLKLEETVRLVTGSNQFVTDTHLQGDIDFFNDAES
jgi:hypothetical protein